MVQTIEERCIKDREYSRQWRKNNPEKRKAYVRTEERKKMSREHCRKYREKNPEKVKESRKKHYGKNKNNIEWKKKRRESFNKYRRTAKAKIKAKTIRSTIEAKEKRKAYNKRPEVIIKKRTWMRIYLTNKYRTDTNHATGVRLRCLLNAALKRYTKGGKTNPSKKYGINYKKIINHLKPFPADITKYHIDHIKPLYSFNLENPEEVKKAFAPENHQWLSASDNLSKGKKQTVQLKLS